MKLSDFKNEKVTVMGLGIVGGGVGIVKFLVRHGAKVLVTDLKTKKYLKSSLKKIRGLPIELVLGRHRKEDFINTDMVIRNPAVPDNSLYLKIAKKHNIPIETDVGIFFEFCKTPIIGVTGTKGKSTVVTLINLLLKSKYTDVILAGNIGISPLESLNKIRKNSKVVLELSSWQLEGLKSRKKSPQTALITNIYPDHLNRYRNLKDYTNSKKLIFLFQKSKDFLFLNYDDKILRKFSKVAKSRVYFFSKNKTQKDSTKAAFLKKNEIFFGKELKPIFNLKNLRLDGEHNISNVLAAVSIAKLYNVPSKNIQNVLRKFKGLSGREELIARIKGIRYFNDTTATMPGAVIAALLRFTQKFPQSKIILIAGGQDKKLNYRKLAREISEKVNHLILFPGTASTKLKKNLDVFKAPKSLLSVTPGVDSMERAVRIASKLAGREGIVLLSPGAASFNLFKNEFDRGDKFNKIVKKLQRGKSAGFEPKSD
ncbi:UDP-N-acetylmuramoyl-L-alanine--D-glutamate ligase [Patescibacteria group bacterium]|nr:UDP-N-acetylmuramoyl-L-alanine--D-glutamate ligase [Patescibacteria group bacterium]